MDDVVILSAVRTPIGVFQGALSGLSAHALGARAIAAAIERAGLTPEEIEQVNMGCVLTAGQGQAPARQAALGAGCPVGTGAITLNKVCGSGMRAAMIAANDLRCGDFKYVVAGGMESMSQAPYLAAGVRDGLRLGHGKLVDSMIHDGLWDPYGDVHMGSCAEICAADYKFDREAQDAYSLESYRRSREATEKGLFAEEIVPVSVPGRKGETVVDRDEEPFKADLAKIATLRPAFQKENGTVTAGNASKINDGAAALVLTRRRRGRPPGARSRSPASSPTPRSPRSRSGSPPRRAGPSAACWSGPGSRRPTSISGRSTRRSPWWRWPSCATSSCRPTASTCAAARCRWGIRSAPPAPASWSRCCTRCASGASRLGCAAICIGGGEATAMIVERVD